MNHNTLEQAIGTRGYACPESLAKSIGDDMARKGLSSIGMNIHAAPGHKGPAIAKEQGGRQYAAPIVKSGSLRSSVPGRGEGRGSPHKKR